MLREFKDRRTRADKNKFLCRDCKKDTINYLEDYYMVTDEIWEKHGCGEGMLCIKCLEARMGRKLKKADVRTCPLNYDNPYTAKLLTQ